MTRISVGSNSNTESSEVLGKLSGELRSFEEVLEDYFPDEVERKAIIKDYEALMSANGGKDISPEEEKRQYEVFLKYTNGKDSGSFNASNPPKELAGNLFFLSVKFLFEKIAQSLDISNQIKKTIAKLYPKQKDRQKLNAEVDEIVKELGDEVAVKKAFDAFTQKPDDTTNPFYKLSRFLDLHVAKKLTQNFDFQQALDSTLTKKEQDQILKKIKEKTGLDLSDKTAFDEFSDFIQNDGFTPRKKSKNIDNRFYQAKLLLQSFLLEKVKKDVKKIVEPTLPAEVPRYITDNVGKERSRLFKMKGIDIAINFPSFWTSYYGAKNLAILFGVTGASANTMAYQLLFYTIAVTVGFGSYYHRVETGMKVQAGHSFWQAFFLSSTGSKRNLMLATLFLASIGFMDYGANVSIIRSLIAGDAKGGFSDPLKKDATNARESMQALQQDTLAWWEHLLKSPEYAVEYVAKLKRRVSGEAELAPEIVKGGIALSVDRQLAQTVSDEFNTERNARAAKYGNVACSKDFIFRGRCRTAQENEGIATNPMPAARAARDKITGIVTQYTGRDKSEVQYHTVGGLMQEMINKFLEGEGGIALKNVVLGFKELEYGEWYLERNAITKTLIYFFAGYEISLSDIDLIGQSLVQNIPKLRADGKLTDAEALKLVDLISKLRDIAKLAQDGNRAVDGKGNAPAIDIKMPEKQLTTDSVNDLRRAVAMYRKDDALVTGDPRSHAAMMAKYIDIRYFHGRTNKSLQLDFLESKIRFLSELYLNDKGGIDTLEKVVKSPNANTSLLLEFFYGKAGSVERYLGILNQVSANIGSFGLSSGEQKELSDLIQAIRSEIQQHDAGVQAETTQVTFTQNDIEEVKRIISEVKSQGDKKLRLSFGDYSPDMKSQLMAYSALGVILMLVFMFEMLAVIYGRLSGILEERGYHSNRVLKDRIAELIGSVEGVVDVLNAFVREKKLDEVLGIPEITKEQIVVGFMNFIEDANKGKINLDGRNPFQVAKDTASDITGGIVSSIGSVLDPAYHEDDIRDYHKILKEIAKLGKSNRAFIFLVNYIIPGGTKLINAYKKFDIKDGDKTKMAQLLSVQNEVTKDVLKNKISAVRFKKAAIKFLETKIANIDLSRSSSVSRKELGKLEELFTAYGIDTEGKLSANMGGYVAIRAILQEQYLKLESTEQESVGLLRLQYQSTLLETNAGDEQLGKIQTEAQFFEKITDEVGAYMGAEADNSTSVLTGISPEVLMVQNALGDFVNSLESIQDNGIVGKKFQDGGKIISDKVTQKFKFQGYSASTKVHSGGFIGYEVLLREANNGAVIYSKKIPFGVQMSIEQVIADLQYDVMKADIKVARHKKEKEIDGLLATKKSAAGFDYNGVLSIGTIQSIGDTFYEKLAELKEMEMQQKMLIVLDLQEDITHADLEVALKAPLVLKNAGWDKDKIKECLNGAMKISLPAGMSFEYDVTRNILSFKKDSTTVKNFELSNTAINLQSIETEVDAIIHPQTPVA